MRKSWKINRRWLFAGAGSALALPLLEQMNFARAQANGARRYLGICMPNGVPSEQWVPAATGANYTLTTAQTSLEVVKSDIMVVSGLSNKIAEQNGIGSLHYGGVAGLLTCAVPQPGSSPVIGISIDQVLANAVRSGTRIASLQLGLKEGTTVGSGAQCGAGTPCVYGRELSWSGPSTPVLKEISAKAAFDRIFTGVSPTPAPPPGPDPAPAPAPTVDKEREYNQSVLDAVRADAQLLQARLGASDKERLEQYLTAVRELELRVGGSGLPTGGGGEPGGGGTVPISSGCQPGTGPAATLTYEEHVAAMYEVIALAFQCDLTRVATLLLGEAECDYVFRSLGQGAVWHEEVSHGQPQAHNEIIRWHLGEFAKFVMRLKGMVEPGGTTVLDQSAVFFGSDVNDGPEHTFTDMPVILAGRAGGAINPGRHVRFNGQPLANLHLTMAQAVGLTQQSFANSTGTVNLA
ncbi:MAG: DUF1552 domain-containing protein [Polyangiaceae bacterium]|nr:DUF1552 domain-containing protein [Polyangiaceae bacterium]